jgi:hypothetical protein
MLRNFGHAGMQKLDLLLEVFVHLDEEIPLAPNFLPKIPFHHLVTGRRPVTPAMPIELFRANDSPKQPPSFSVVLARLAECRDA